MAPRISPTTLARRRRILAGLVCAPVLGLAGRAQAFARAEEASKPGSKPTSLRALLDRLSDLADRMAEHPDVLADYAALLEERKLQSTDALLHDYVRVKLAFESTRDGGWWHARWDITNRKPNSEQMWAQWRSDPSPGTADAPQVTATAECDELSAMFAFLVRRLGVDRVGLFWPEWNHVVAVWSVTQDDVTHRIVVPTSQIFVSADASLGTREFRPWKQKTIYTYKRKDTSLQTKLPSALFDFFVDQAEANAMLPQAQQQERRNARSAILDGS